MSSVADCPEGDTGDADSHHAPTTRLAFSALVRRADLGIVVGVMVLALVLAGCIQPVGPAWDFDSYEAKAKHTAETALSGIETARLTVQTAKNDDAFAPFVAVALSDAEGEAANAHATFDKVQPPSQKADDLRDELDPLLVRADDALSNARIAARRADLGEVAKQAKALTRSAKELKAFVEAHS